MMIMMMIVRMAADDAVRIRRRQHEQPQPAPSRSQSQHCRSAGRRVHWIWCVVNLWLGLVRSASHTVVTARRSGATSPRPLAPRPPQAQVTRRETGTIDVLATETTTKTKIIAVRFMRTRTGMLKKNKN